jgi:predicted deacylase
MPAGSSRKLKRFVAGFWVLNLITGLFIIIVWSWMNTPVKAFFISPTPTPTSSSTLTATLTLTLTPTLLPTETATPTKSLTPTNPPTETLPPISFSEGPIKIGESVKGLPLEVYRFGTGPIERLIIAGIHGGNEYNTVQLAEQLMEYINEHPKAIPPDVTLYILHDLNPDGVARALNHLGRANANGVDLNRNWPDGWKKDWNRSGCWTTTYVTGGSKPASEPETQALMAFVKSHQFSALINYHSAALGIFPGGVPPTEASKRFAKALAAVSTYKYPPLDTGCEYSGGLVDWTADLGIPSVDVELTNHTNTDLDMNLRILNVILNWKQ